MISVKNMFKIILNTTNYVWSRKPITLVKCCINKINKS